MLSVRPREYKIHDGRELAVFTTKFPDLSTVPALTTKLESAQQKYVDISQEGRRETVKGGGRSSNQGRVILTNKERRSSLVLPSGKACCHARSECRSPDYEKDLHSTGTGGRGADTTATL